MLVHSACHCLLIRLPALLCSGKEFDEVFAALPSGSHSSMFQLVFKTV
jgi:hypothetical protein